MSNQTTVSPLAPYIERARKVLQHEQRTNHQDQAVKPGGLELFAVRWADDASTICKTAGLDLKPIHRFTEHFEGYRQQDPLQRAASLRAALAILDELQSNGHPAQSQGQTRGTTSDGQARNLHRPPDVAVHHPPEARPTKIVPTQSENISTSPPVQAEKTDGKAAPGAPARPTTTTTSDGQARATGRVPIDRARGAPTQAVPPKQNTIRLEAGMSQGHTALTLLTADVTAIPGVGQTVAGKLRTLGIRTVRDLLFYFPREHRDYSKLEKIANIPFNELTTTKGLIWEAETTHLSGGRTRTVATISDETGKLRVSWFNQPYLQKQLQAAKGEYIVVTGVKQRFGNKIEFNVRSHEFPEQKDMLNTGRLVPIYSLTEGLSAKTLRRFTKWVVDRYAAMVPEHLPMSIRSAGQFMPLPEAVSHIHYPENEQALLAARRRLAFDELFLIQLGMQERRSRWQREAPQGNAFKIDLTKIFIDAQPDIGAQCIAPVNTPTNTPTNTSTKNEDEDDKLPTALTSTLWSTIAANKPFEA